MLILQVGRLLWLPLALLSLVCGCSVPRHQELPAIDFRRSALFKTDVQISQSPQELKFDASKPISPEQWRQLQSASPEEVQGALNAAGKRWLYGPGFGRSASNIGSVVMFPPYAIYLLGNAGLSLAGFEQLYISNLLPQSPRKHVLDFYDGITSVPGRVSALVAGKEYYQSESSTN